MKNSVFLLLAALLMLVACRPGPPTYSPEISVIVDSAAVVSPHTLATDIGVDILQRGGNAVDAAVAVQFAIAVCYPRAGNLGGGGFMVLRLADGEATALDYREKAPAAAERDMYLDSAGNVVPQLSTRGHLAVGVPGTVAGLAAAHERYGSLPWTELVQPAVDLARYGYRISANEAERFNEYMEDFQEFNTESPFLKDNWRAGEVLTQPELAATLERIRDQGRDGFYTGLTAELIAAEMQQGGGLITTQDLADYQPAWRQPVEIEYGSYDVLSMPPASSGGVALGQLLNMVEDYPLAQWGFQSLRTTHLMAEAERRVYADRAEYLGDSDFYPVPIDSLLDENYLSRRMQDFSMDSASVSTGIEAGDYRLLLESFETTHTSVIDAAGNAVSLTTTLNGNFGSKVIVDGAGFFLNNEMDDFSAKPGVPNMFGLIGAEANAIQPGKRMLSSMTPTIIARDGQVVLVLGAPGGSTIITAVFQVILNNLEFGMAIDSAIAAPRFHHQWLPDRIVVEADALTPAVRDSLRALGHELHEVERMAVVKAIRRLPDGRLHASGDARNPDDAAGGF